MSEAAIAVSAADSAPGAGQLSAARLSIAFVVVALTLLAARQALRLPGGQGIEDVLGWVRIDAVRAAVEQWCVGDAEAAMGVKHLRWHIASLYLLVDNLLFMPLYAVLLLLLGRHLHEALDPAESTAGRILRPLLWWWTVAAVGALLLLDATENHGGFQRIGISGLLFFSSLLSGALLGWALWLWCTSRIAARRTSAVRFALAALAAGGVLISFSFFADAPQACADDGAALLASKFSAAMHRSKGGLILLAVAPVLLATVVWMFGIELKRDADSARAGRVTLLRGIFAVIGRTRYVLAALALFAGLTLGLDQCRDVVLGLAKWPNWDEFATLKGWWGLLMLLASVLSIALFVYSCWLWARLACRIKRPGSDTDADAVQVWLGEFSRTWARFLSVVPLLLVYTLIAYALGDAFTAASPLPPSGAPAVTPAAHGLFETVVTLVAFGAVAIAIGVFFLWVRERFALIDPRAYYNSIEDLHALLADDDATPHKAPAQRRSRQLVALLRWLTPRVLPLLALALMVLLRIAIAMLPQDAATAPAALALVALALSWWIGVFGALALVEQTQARPWLLAGVAVVGVLTAAGWSDNHVLPLVMPMADGASLATLRQHGWQLMLLLALLAAALWLLFTYDLKKLGMPVWIQRWGRLAGAFIVGLLAFGVLLFFDKQVPQRATAQAAAGVTVPLRPTLQQALELWAAQLPAAAPGREQVFLIATEGGGIRSAYWTAQVLRQLHARIPDFDRRSFAISGVSGGAVGAAAYSACLRQSNNVLSDEALAKCLDSGFGQLDALSPLLAAFMFEDGLARVLPTKMGPEWYQCNAPACGHLSRALGFEREWQRVFPALAQPIQAVPAGQPHLLLNSTWVETGELALATSLAVDERAFPATRDVQARLGTELSLMGAAHVAARFPFINPLAAVQAGPRAVEAPRKGLAGHLADGGYFDNSGATSMADVWRAMKSVVGPERQPLLLLIRNGKQKAGCERPDPDGPDPQCIVPSKNPFSDAAELEKAVVSHSWGLYADLLGPAVAVLNVSGIRAHGRRSPAELRAELGHTEQKDCATRVRIIDQLEQGTLVPLGWYLSAPARHGLDEQSECVARELQTCYPKAGEVTKPLCR